MSEAVINRNELGQYVDAESNPHAITTQNAHALQKKSVQARLENKHKRTVLAARQAILEEIQAIEPDVQTFEQAWGMLTGNLAVHFLESQSLRDKVQAYRAFGQAADVYEDKSPKGNIGTVNILNVNTMDRDVSQAILQRLYGDDNNYYQKQSSSQVEDNPPIEAEFEPSNDEE